MVKLPIKIQGENLFKKQQMSEDIIEKLSDLLVEKSSGCSSFSDFVNDFHENIDEIKEKTLSKTIKKKYGTGKRELSSNDTHIKFTGLKKNDFS